MEDKESKSNITEAEENYWQEAQLRHIENIMNPEIKKQDFIISAKYWATLFLFSSFVGPLFIITIFWSINFYNELGFFEFYSSGLAKALWVLIIIIGMPLSALLIKKPQSLSWKLALAGLDDKSVPFRNKIF